MKNSLLHLEEKGMEKFPYAWKFFLLRGLCSTYLNYKSVFRYNLFSWNWKIISKNTVSKKKKKKS